MIRGFSIAGARPRTGSKRSTQMSLDRYGGQSNARANARGTIFARGVGRREAILVRASLAAEARREGSAAPPPARRVAPRGAVSRGPLARGAPIIRAGG